MNCETRLQKYMTLVDKLAAEFPEELEQRRSNWINIINEMFALSRHIREENEIKQKSTTKLGTRNIHVGESNYSQRKIQPWDIWIEYQLNPWDADIVKRVLRTKTVPGRTPAECRIQDYQKIKHICDERIDQVKTGDEYYENFQIPEWMNHEPNKRDDY